MYGRIRGHEEGVDIGAGDQALSRSGKRIHPIPRNHIERDRVQTIVEDKYEKLKVQRGNNVTYIGLEIERIGNEFHVGMEKRINKVCEFYNITSEQKKPCRTNFTIRDEEAEYKGETTSKSKQVGKNCNTTEYRSIAMKNRFIASLVVPGVLFHCTYLASLQSSPTMQDYDDCLWLLQYIKSQISQRVIITSIGSNSPEIKVWVDASHKTYGTGRGHGGICIFIGDCKAAVYNKSNKIKPIVRSSADSEIIIMSSGILCGDYFRLFLEEIKFFGNVVYYEDNDACTSNSTQGTDDYLHKTKFMILHINTIKEYFSEPSNMARIERRSTDQMIADIHTKVLHGNRYQHHNNRLIGHY